MSIREEMAEELRDAMRSADGPRRDVIRMIETEVGRARTAPGFEGEVDDALYEKTIAAYCKRMSKSADEYDGLGERGAEMARKLRYETDYLQRWLPQKLDETATAELVRAAIAELGPDVPAGRIVGAVMKARPGELDGGLVNRLVSEALA